MFVKTGKAQTCRKANLFFTKTNVENLITHLFRLGCLLITSKKFTHKTHPPVSKDIIFTILGKRACSSHFSHIRRCMGFQMSEENRLKRYEESLGPSFLVKRLCPLFYIGLWFRINILGIRHTKATDWVLSLFKSLWSIMKIQKFTVKTN